MLHDGYRMLHDDACCMMLRDSLSLQGDAMSKIVMSSTMLPNTFQDAV
jgi:hypothetical protein